ncbi:MAG: hypothetical protein KDD11_21950 [Acidobacteria bacterium]|nr:hypothetical protein [Acidobacteriota bacterium]
MAKKARSRAYPAITLRAAAEAVEHLRSELGTGAWDRQPLAEALGYRNAAGGPGARKIAALTQFGLLRRRHGRYSFTELGETLALYRDGRELDTALEEALRQPPLFAALWQRYEPEGRLPGRLEHALVRDHGITPRASARAAEVFLLSAQYAGVVDLDGRFLGKTSDGHRPGGPERPGAEAAVLGTLPKAEGPGPESGSSGAGLAGRAGAGEQRFEIALGGGRRAVLVLPAVPTARDLALLKKQLELLELQVELAGSDPG